MRRTSSWLAIASSVLLMGMTECGRCPDPEQRRIESGTYQRIATEELSVNGEDDVLSPRHDVDDVLMTVDVEERTVVIEYARDGQTVVETWRW